MPFLNVSGRPFKAAAIRRDAPACSGVYGLSNAREWIYVGETDNIQGRLLELLERGGSLPGGTPPTGFNFEPCSAHERVGRQRQLILELEPAGNRQERRG